MLSFFSSWAATGPENKHNSRANRKSKEKPVLKVAFLASFALSRVDSSLCVGLTGDLGGAIGRSRPVHGRVYLFLVQDLGW